MAYYDRPSPDRRYRQRPLPQEGFDAPASGPTTDRPDGVPVGFQYFDTDLGFAIWWDGSAWVDATGADPDEE